MLDMIILGLLKIREMTSYDIKVALENSVNHFYSSSLGSINPALRKLYRRKAVESKETVENNRMKKYYRITESGREEYQNWISQPFTTGRIKEDALVHLFFLGDTEREMQNSLLEAYLEEIDATRRNFEEMKRAFEDREIPVNLQEKARFQMATLQFGIDYARFSHQWFSDLIEKLDNKQ